MMTPDLETYVSLRKQETRADFSGSACEGVVVESAGGRADVRLASKRRSPPEDGQPGTWQALDWCGVLTSPVMETPQPFDTLIPSWNAVTPPGTWISLEVRAGREDGHWTRYYSFGVWATGDDNIRRRSVEDQRDAHGGVATDTLLLSPGHPYVRYQYRLRLFTLDPMSSPHVGLVTIMTSDSRRELEGLRIEPRRDVWGINLPVLERSQMLYMPEGAGWCSPTCCAMVLAYFGRDVTIPEAAAGTYDHAYEGTGNWPFNTAWASTHGLEAFVTRFVSMAQVESWIAARVPVVLSLGWDVGDLPGAPIRVSDGHLIVVRGFTASGDVIVNDPAAATDESVRRVYPRETLERLWLKHSGGTVYLMYPHGSVVPAGSGGSW